MVYRQRHATALHYHREYIPFKSKINTTEHFYIPVSDPPKAHIHVISNEEHDLLQKIFDETFDKIAQAYNDKKLPSGHISIPSYALIFVEQVTIPIMKSAQGAEPDILENKVKALVFSFRSTIDRIMKWEQFQKYATSKEMDGMIEMTRNLVTDDGEGAEKLAEAKKYFTDNILKKNDVGSGKKDDPGIYG